MKAHTLTVYLPDARNVEISRYGYGNLKLGIGVFTYSRMPGSPDRPALGTGGFGGTCPGSTPECESICYAARVTEEHGHVSTVWRNNTMSEDVPPIPDDCKLLRLHVSGDFTSVEYIDNWIARLRERPDVTAWTYTRSWRVPTLLPALERLRALPNLQLFASMDPTTVGMPPDGWRRSWIYREHARMGYPMEMRLILSRNMLRVSEADKVLEEYGWEVNKPGDLMTTAVDGVPSYVCPEETGKKPNCVACGYCFEGQKHDVTFIEH